jgi:hypothetical protein
MMEFVPSNLVFLSVASVLKSQKRTFYCKVAERLVPSVWVCHEQVNGGENRIRGAYPQLFSSINFHDNEHEWRAR